MPAASIAVVQTVHGIRKFPSPLTSAPNILALTTNRAKKKKFPDGYPGDGFSDDITKPVKYSCHKCSKVFPAVPHPDSDEGKTAAEKGEKLECVRCKHEKCADCQRAQPAKVEPAPDPEVLKSVQAKLAGLGVSSSS